MGWVNPRVELGRVGLGWDGLRFIDFWWVGLCRGSETAETQKLKIFICAEFIEATNVVDTDGHGVSKGLGKFANVRIKLFREFVVRRISNFFSAPVR